jgi:hypothetical protein
LSNISILITHDPFGSLLNRLLTDPIFLDLIPDPDPFEKLDLIPHSDPLTFSGSPIRSDPIQPTDPFGFLGTKNVFPFELV